MFAFKVVKISFRFFLPLELLFFKGIQAKRNMLKFSLSPIGKFSWQYIAFLNMDAVLTLVCGSVLCSAGHLTSLPLVCRMSSTFYEVPSKAPVT